MFRTPIVASLLLASACSQQDKAAAPSNEVNEAAAAERAPADAKTVPSLEGPWSVAAIDGRPVSSGSMSATFKGRTAVIAAGCIRRAWTYTQKGNIVSFATDPGGSANCGGGTSGEQESAFAALEKTSIAIFNKDGSEASLSGTGGNLTLQRR